MKKVPYVFLAFMTIIFVPFFTALLENGGTFPEGFFTFPPLDKPEKPGFNLWVFIGIALIGVGFLLLYLFPTLFGFKKPPKLAPVTLKKVSFPWWFWLGLVMWAGVLTVYWGKFEEPKWIVNWGAIYLFWGITFVLDGLTYKRAGGRSIINDYPSEILGIGVVSIPGWMLFEYLNLFVSVDWYYPAGNLIPNTQFFLYALLGSSGLLPMAFVLYSLMCTFRGFKARYAYGPRLSLNRSMKFLLLLMSIVFLVLTGIWSNTLFLMVWMAPVTLLTMALVELDIWTPFRPIRENGDWSAVLVFGLSYFFIGILLEGQNYFTAYHLADGSIQTYNPDFWAYSIPFVDVLHVFEMPMLGLLGYIPFSIYCWVVWIIFAWFLNIKAMFLTDPYPVRE